MKMGRVDFLGSAHICIIEAQTQLRTCLGVIPYFLLNIRLLYSTYALKNILSKGLQLALLRVNI